MDQLTKHMTSDAKGWYEENKRWNADNGASASPVQYFAWKAREEYGVYPEDPILERREEHFLRHFKVQPEETTRDLAVRQYAADTWAIEKYWAEQKNPWHGPMSGTVEKAFTTSALQGTFPIFFDQALLAGRLTSGVRQRLVAETVPTNSGIANHTEIFTDGAAGTLQGTNPLARAVETGEGARTTQVSIKVRERQIALKKFGYEALASYEALRRARLPVFQRTLETVGANFEILLTDFAIDVLVLGDGTLPSNAAGTVASTVAGAPVYADYINLIMSAPQPYNFDLLVGNKEAIIRMLNVAEFKDPLAGFSFQNRGVIPSPFGVPLLRWDTTGNTTAWPNSTTTSKLMAMVTNLGLVEYTEGGVITESDRIIESGWERVVSTTWIAYGIMDPDSRKVGTGFGTAL
jgi:hypothetical protein